MKRIAFLLLLSAAAAVVSAQPQVMLVDVVPNARSNETERDAEPNIAVNPANPQQIAISAFTFDPLSAGLGPIYVSTNGGADWTLVRQLPGGNKTNDTTLRFGGLSGTLYVGILRLDNGNQEILRTPTFTTESTLASLTSRNGPDQPWVESATVMVGAAPDRAYVGNNDDSGATLDQSLDIATAAAPAGLSAFDLEGSTSGCDGPPVRPAVHPSGRIYTAFLRLPTCGVGGYVGDVIVTRDDAWAQTAPEHNVLTTGTIRGTAVATGLSIPFGDLLGPQRVGGAMSIAVDPRDANRVFVAYGEGSSGADNRLHVCRSTNGGTDWTCDLRIIDHATNPALAVNNRGVAAFLYQQFVGGRWETHLETSDDGFTTAPTNNLTLANVANINNGINTLGDYVNLRAVGKDFYGVFSAANTPDPANFPNGVTFLRNRNETTHELRNVADTANVAASIDPFFFRVRLAPAEQDFYVRDWNDGTTGDDGSEPSTHPVFYQTGDVWNRRGTLPGTFGANDPPPGEDAGNGVDTIGDNWLFARVRRNSGGTSGITTVRAHFLVSKFGTGSPYADASTADPDLSFPDPDPTVTFGPADTAPATTPAYHWHLGALASTHLCIAVETEATGSGFTDAFVAPSLAGQTPGWPDTDLRVLNDNNKAQRNIGLSTTPARGVGFSDASMAIAHNAATFARDMVLSYDVDSRDARKIHPRVSIDGGEPVKIAGHGTLVLRNMQPGENRWIELQFDGNGLDEGEVVPVNFAELVGTAAVNGFTIAVRGGTLPEVMQEKTRLHREVFTRLAALGVAGAREEAEAAEAALKDPPYESFLHARGASLMRVLGGYAPLAENYGRFRLTRDLDVLKSALAGSDPARAAAAHSALLNRLDSAITRAQLAEGDPADIAGNVRWQRDLFTRNATLAHLSCAGDVVSRSETYLGAISNRSITNAAYPSLLRDLRNCYGAAASATGDTSLMQRAASLGMQSSLAAMQKAHREILLALSR